MSWAPSRLDPCFLSPREATQRRGIRGTRVRRTGFGRPAVFSAPRQQPRPTMALTRSISRLDLAPVPATVGDAIERGPLLAYIDLNQRYRFANKALLDWFGRRPDEVLGREIIEVMGRESYQLYRAY